MHSARRWAIAALGGTSLVLLVTFVTGVLADLYGIVSAEQRWSGAPTLAAISAAQRAVSMQQWRPIFHADLGWAFGVRGDMLRMNVQYKRALRFTPASAYLWLEYAEALARNYRFDSEYTVALAQATTLAPNALPVQAGAARMGSRHWNSGDEKDRWIWAQNMSYVLRNKPYELLWTVVREGREASFCGFVGSELGLARWCVAVSAARQICDSLPPQAKGPAADECERLGLQREPPSSDQPHGEL